ncbi:MAG: hypothetical protein K6F68_08000 [Clostridiales bacterium]|nr:hypothetical protein [Clostridiales bacterium]
MKRFLILLLAALTAVSAAACVKPNKPDPIATMPPETTGAPAVTAEPGDAFAFVTDGSKVGVLQNAGDPAFLRINGLIITTGSGHHEYPAIEELAEAGYKTEGLYAEYYLSEWFDVYADIEGDGAIGVYVLPNDPNADYSKMKDADLLAVHESLDYPVYHDVPHCDAEDHGLLFEAYVHEENGPGLYNIIFTDGENIIYMVQLRILPLPEE